MKDTHDEPQSGGDAEPEITLIAVADETFYIVEGDEYLDQILLVDGIYPTPILCIHFETINDIREAMGEAVDMSEYWTIHPKIIKRFRDSKIMIEKVG
ncbi:MAG: hypothetical protein AAF865_17380 [Pseudomonadota bacterium]